MSLDKPLIGDAMSGMVANAVEYMVDAGQRSVLFLDIRGFTAMTRVRPAGETVALLNDFFAEMIDVVDRNHGIINKFLGDGFLALFGAPGGSRG